MSTHIVPALLITLSVIVIDPHSNATTVYLNYTNIKINSTDFNRSFTEQNCAPLAGGDFTDGGEAELSSLLNGGLWVFPTEELTNSTSDSYCNQCVSVEN